MPACDGCLDSHRCWVCLGHGVLESSRGMTAPCHRCFATGKCTLCQPIVVADLGSPPDPPAHPPPPVEPTAD